MAGEAARDAVFVKSAPVPLDSLTVAGPRFRVGTTTESTASAVDASAAINCFGSLATTGFQATNLGRAADLIRDMLRGRDDDEHNHADASPPVVRCVVYVGVVANLMATGVRDALRAAAAAKKFDHVVLSAGGVEHDLRRLFNAHHDYRAAVTDAQIAAARAAGRVTIANVTYRPGPCAGSAGGGGAIDTCCFPHAMASICRKMRREPRLHRSILAEHVPRQSGLSQREPPFPRPTSGEASASAAGAELPRRLCYTPSAFYREVAQRLDEALPSNISDDSFAIQCVRAGVNLFCPSFVDGDMAEILLADDNADVFSIDLLGDLDALNRSALAAKRTGMFIIGGGVVKHHICNANLMRNGADLGVFVNTGQEFDGSDGGARPDEAVSWGKLRLDSKSVKVYCEATLAVPYLVADGFGVAPLGRNTNTA